MHNERKEMQIALTNIHKSKEIEETTNVGNCPQAKSNLNKQNKVVNSNSTTLVFYFNNLYLTAKRWIVYAPIFLFLNWHYSLT